MINQNQKPAKCYALLSQYCEYVNCQFVRKTFQEYILGENFLIFWVSSPVRPKCDQWSERQLYLHIALGYSDLNCCSADCDLYIYVQGCM